MVLYSKEAKAVVIIAYSKKIWVRVFLQYVRVNNCTKEVWSKLTCISNISFFDLLRIPSKRPRVLFTEMEESGWLLVILMPLDEIYLESQVVCSCSESSEIPFLFIRTTVEMMAGPEMTNLLSKFLMMVQPSCSIF